MEPSNPSTTQTNLKTNVDPFAHLDVARTIKNAAQMSATAMRLFNEKSKRRRFSFAERAKLLLEMRRKDGTTLMDDLVLIITDQAIRQRDPTFVKLLLDRIEGGVQENINISGQVMSTGSVDLSKLSNEQLEQLSKILAAGARTNGNGTEVITVDSNKGESHG